MPVKTTLFSVSYAGLWGQACLDAGAFIEKTAALGYEAVELMCKRPHLSVVDTREEHLATLKQKADAAGIEIATMAGYTDFTASKDAREVPFTEMQIAYVRRLAEMGRFLGAKIVRVFTGYTTEPDSCQADWTASVRAIRECAAVAADYGLVLGVQNHHDIAVGRNSYLEFLNDVDHPNCRAMFDPWSVALIGEDLYEAAKAVAPYMVQTTLADYVRLPRYTYVPGLINYRELTAMVRAVPVGDGFLDLEAFFAGLRAGGFDGYVAYEMCSPLRGGGDLENLDATARKSLARIHALRGTSL